jgi:hypothetical protein
VSTTSNESIVTGDDIADPVVEPRTLGDLRRRAVIALIAGLAVNLAALGVALLALGGAGGFEPLGVVPVTTTTVIATLGAAVVYAALHRFTDRANRNFTAVATVVLLASAATLQFATTLPGATTTKVAALAVLHVLPYAVAVVVLTDRRPLA